MLGFAFINALVFAKVMMLFEVFDPGRWLRARPLIYPILCSLVTVLFLVAHVIEKTIEGMFVERRSLTACPRSAAGSWDSSASPPFSSSRSSRFSV
jgi:hypothetical protein